MRERFHADRPTRVPTGSDIEVSRHEGDHGAAPSGGGVAKTTKASILRKVAGKLVPIFSKAVVDWSVDRARKSLDGSLRRLGRGRIDLYLLHEPEAHLLATDEWLSWLESERDRVAAFGIAADAAKVPAVLTGGNPLARIVQYSDSIANAEADVLVRAGVPLQITYGYIASAKRDPKADIEAALAAALRRQRRQDGGSRSLGVWEGIDRGRVCENQTREADILVVGAGTAGLLIAVLLSAARTNCIFTLVASFRRRGSRKGSHYFEAAAARIDIISTLILEF